MDGGMFINDDRAATGFWVDEMVKILNSLGSLDYLMGGALERLRHLGFKVIQWSHVGVRESCGVSKRV